MGGAGMFATFIFNPILGHFLDAKTSGGEALRTVAILPLILVFLFTGLYIYMKKKGTTSHS